MNANKGWTQRKPEKPGIYQVRGFDLCKPEHKQSIATITVAKSLYREDKKALVCNLHESTSDSNHESWWRVEDLSDEFQWRGPFVLSGEAP